MKRARADVEEGFNPVYPYDEDKGGDNATGGAAIPPFVASNGLQEDPPGFLALKLANPMGFTDLGSLTLKLGSGLSVDSQGNLTAASLTRVQAPLTNNNGTLGLTVADGLEVVSNALQVKIGKGLYLDSTNSNRLTTKAGTAFIFDNSGTLQYNLGKGLTKENNQLTVKAGAGLVFNSLGTLETLPSTITPFTLWTTVNPPINACLRPENSTDTTLNARVFLCLTRSGPQVVGVLAVTGTGAPINPINTTTTTNLTLSLQFDSDGELRTSLFNTASLGVKSGTGIDTSTTVNKTLFMPNSTMYPRSSTTTNASKLFFNCYVGSRFKTCSLEMTLNENTPGSGYAINLKWANFSPTFSGETFSTGMTHFSYLAERDNP